MDESSIRSDDLNSLSINEYEASAERNIDEEIETINEAIQEETSQQGPQLPRPQSDGRSNDRFRSQYVLRTCSCILLLFVFFAKQT